MVRGVDILTKRLDAEGVADDGDSVELAALLGRANRSSSSSGVDRDMTQRKVF